MSNPPHYLKEILADLDGVFLRFCLVGSSDDFDDFN